MIIGKMIHDHESALVEKEHSGELSRDGGWTVDACVQRIAS